MTLPVISVAGSRPLAPRVGTFTEPFWSALSDGRFLVSRCGSCDHLTFPPKCVCPRCRRSDMSWHELSGAGRLYSLTRVHVGPQRFSNDMPYAVAIVDLDEGVRLVTRVLEPAAFDDLDKAVELVTLRYDDGALFAARLKGDADV